MPGTIARNRDAVTERREAVLAMTRRGVPAWKIAFDLRVTPRTVQRHRDNERAARPVGKPALEDTPRVRERRRRVARMVVDGWSIAAMARELGASRNTVRRDVRAVIEESGS